MDVLGVHEVLRYMNRIPGYADISMFIETGTGRCGSTFQMCALFDSVATVEASDKLFNLMSQVYRNTKVNFFHGESHVVLYELSVVDEGWKEPVVFYLDAHWYKSGSGDAIYSGEPAPVLKELEVIYERPYGDLIIIDDSRLFGKKTGNLDWSHITEDTILKAIGEETVVDSYEENDRYLIFRNSGERVPRSSKPKIVPVEEPEEVKRVGQFF